MLVLQVLESGPQVLKPGLDSCLHLVHAVEEVERYQRPIGLHDVGDKFSGGVGLSDRR